MSKGISSIRLVRLNDLCAFLGNETQRGKATHLDVVLRKIGYDEGVKDRKSALRLLQRDILVLETHFSAKVVHNTKNNSLKLFRCYVGVIDFSEYDVDAPEVLPVAS